MDRPGVIARDLGHPQQGGISISSIIQPEGHEGETVPVILMTHAANRAAMERCCAAIARIPAVKGPSRLLPVEDFA